MKNYWVSCGHRYTFAKWEATFNSMPSDLSRIIQFAEDIATLGKETAVYHLRDFMALPFYVKQYDILGFYPNAFVPTYGEYLKQLMDKTGSLSIFETYNNAIMMNAPARICYYNHDGKIVERSIRDLGLLLEELGLGQIGNTYARRMSPIQIIGDTLSLGSANNWWLKIALWTDIWLPWVHGWREKHENTQDFDPYSFDNRELAHCHTPRLNKFISGVRNMVLELGGTWEISDEEFRTTREMITETGINLDIQKPS